MNPATDGNFSSSRTELSGVLTQDEIQPAAQAMLYGIGLTEDDLKKSTGGYCKHGLR